MSRPSETQAHFAVGIHFFHSAAQCRSVLLWHHQAGFAVKHAVGRAGNVGNDNRNSHRLRLDDAHSKAFAVARQNIAVGGGKVFFNVGDLSGIEYAFVCNGFVVQSAVYTGFKFVAAENKQKCFFLFMQGVISLEQLVDALVAVNPAYKNINKSVAGNAVAAADFLL